ncbi:MAG: lysophospholipase [Desulfuromonadaceae bacterium]|nr:lysophospholipase [Desulfuromonadaceae bacterium]MDD5106974.1 lysophospholipase [Desulfuromonadaceae bacterium]
MFRIKNKITFSGTALVLLVLSTACEPRVNHPGNKVREPKLEQGRYITEDGTVLPVRTWLPKNIPIKAVIVALHGFNDYSNAFSGPGSYLSRRGIACYAYDQRGFGYAPGHGLWSGTEAYANDLTNFVNEVHKYSPDVPLYVLGESMGGAVTIVAMTGDRPPHVDGIILVAPAVWGRDTMPWYQRWLLACASHTVPWMKLTGKVLGITPSDNKTMLRPLGLDSKVIRETRIDAMYGLTNLMDAALSQAGKLRAPTLVQYGKHDQIIPRKPMFLMLEKVPVTTRKAFYKNGYHMLLRDLQREKPLADIAAWVSNRNGRLPFGKDTWN